MIRVCSPLHFDVSRGPSGREALLTNPDWILWPKTSALLKSFQDFPFSPGIPRLLWDAAEAGILRDQLDNPRNYTPWTAIWVERGKKKGRRFEATTPWYYWCRRGDLNPHRDYSPLDPESSASANSATSAFSIRQFIETEPLLYYIFFD